MTLKVPIGLWLGWNVVTVKGHRYAYMKSRMEGVSGYKGGHICVPSAAAVRKDVPRVDAVVDS